MSALLPKADSVTMLDAVCMQCFQDGAKFSLRLTDDTQLKLIGGAESYKAVCRSCYHKAHALAV